MTQQPYAPPPAPGYPPQQPQYPPPGYPPQQPQYQPPPQPYGQQYQPQGYGQPYQPPVPPPPPLAHGTIDDFYDQPSTGGGPAISWKGKPDGYTIDSYVARAITNADIQQDTDPQTRQPRTFRDGRPKLSMQVPINVAVTQEFPEGQARMFVRGQLRDELVRAMTEVGAPGNVPEEGAFIRWTLAYRKPTNAIPQNIYQVLYVRPGGQVPPPVQQPQAQPVQQQYQQPQATQPPVTWAPPAPPVQVAFNAPVPPMQPPAQPVQPPAPQPQAQQAQQPAQPPAPPAPQPQAPAPQAQAQVQQPGPGPDPLAGMTDEQRALVAKLQGGGGA